MWKVILILGLVIGVFAGGYYLGRGQKEVTTVEKVVEKEGKEHIVFKDHIVTVTKTVHVDGTTTETTATEDKDQTKDTKTSSTSTDEETSTKSLASNYSLGVSYYVHYEDMIQDIRSFQIDQLQVSVGRRIIGDVWLDLGVRRHEFSLGVRLEF